MRIAGARHILDTFFTRLERGKGVVCHVARVVGQGGGGGRVAGTNPNVGGRYAPSIPETSALQMNRDSFKKVTTKGKCNATLLFLNA